jgi:hypothetical protein
MDWGALLRRSNSTQQFAQWFVGASEGSQVTAQKRSLVGAADT